LFAGAGWCWCWLVLVLVLVLAGATAALLWWTTVVTVGNVASAVITHDDLKLLL
jgi:hypothetical protein